VTFTGCGGFAITPWVRADIATQACLPVLRAPADVYAALRSILVYPDEFRVTETFEEDGVVTERENLLAGQAFDASRIILSWQDVAAAGPGYNVVVHECAHHLDHVAPADEGPHAAAWHAALEEARETLTRRLESGTDDPLDEYALEHPEEFFAVASETFFESPEDLRSAHASLYAALERYYGVDPATWPSAGTVDEPVAP
jgi:MtfA peptidase